MSETDLEFNPQGQMFASRETIREVFESDWENAPRSMRYYVEEEIAGYWFRRGAQAKEFEMLQLQNEDLKEMARLARERRL